MIEGNIMIDGNTAFIVSMVFTAAIIDDKRITTAFSLIFLFISYLR